MTADERQNSGLPTDGIANPNAVGPAKASRYLEHGRDRVSRLEYGQLASAWCGHNVSQNFAYLAAGNPNKVKREIHAPHPKTRPSGSRKYEQHATPFSQNFPARQPAGPKFIGVGHLGSDGNSIDGNRDRFLPDFGSPVRRPQKPPGGDCRQYADADDGYADHCHISHTERSR